MNSIHCTNATGQGTNDVDVEVWDQFRICLERCTALRMELTAAGVHLGPYCFISPELQTAPTQIKLKAQPAGLECFNRYL
jgi:hypothetical protein